VAENTASTTARERHGIMDNLMMEFELVPVDRVGAVGRGRVTL
jgi:hypothetical protein